MCGLQLHVVRHLELNCVKYERKVQFDIFMKAAQGKIESQLSNRFSET